jgi:hypothetical protein
MFSTGTYTPTYTAPIKATGEIARRQRNDAMGQMAFYGDNRQYNQDTAAGKGVAAGGLGAQFRASLTGDMAAGKRAAQAQTSMLDFLKDSAAEDARFASGRADETNSLSSLLLDRDKINTDFDLNTQKRRMEGALAAAQRGAEERIADMQRKARTSQSILGLFGLA